MGLFLLLSAVGLAIWTSVSRLQERVRRLESELVESRAIASRLDALSARVAALDGGPLGAARRPHEPVRAPAAVPPLPQPASEARETVTTQPPADQPPRGLRHDADAEDALADPRERQAGSAAITTDMAPAVAAAAAVPADTPPSGVAPRLTVTNEPTSEAWELVVGTSWLNKIGVLIFVTGLALLLGYSMTHVGPAGRVFIGFFVSGAMLAAGVAFERRPPYRPFGLGLVAGGWAGAYVTAFAMHAIPTARIIESDAVGLLALLAVAGSMVMHSLRYHSETLTSLAYAAAFLPVAITPLTTFSLVATLPLVASLLVVAQRLGWSTLSILGVVSTYGLFVLRGRVLPGDPLDGTTLLPYVLLGIYWLTFETADIAGARRARTRGETSAPLFAVNAAGYLGAFVSVVRAESSTLTAGVLFAMAAAYLGSAVVRARLGAGADARADETPAFTSTHAALCLSAMLTAWSIDLRLEGPRETLFLLIESELLIATALALGDRQIRRIGTAVAALVTVHAAAVAFASPEAETVWSLATWTPTLGLVAIAWYVNREWLRRLGAALDPVERLYSWTASAFVGLIIAREFGDAYQGLAGLALAFGLSEVGQRQRSEYSWQSRAALLVAVSALLGAFFTGEDVGREMWLVLPAAAALGYLYAWRHVDSTTPEAATASLTAAAVGSCAGTAFIVLLEWHAVTNVWVLALWALTAVALVGLGARFRQSILRWQSYGLVMLGSIPAVAGLLFDMRMDGRATTSLLAVVASLFVTGYVGRRASTSGVERFVTGFVALVGTVALTIFKWRVLPREALAPAWAAEALVLVWLGSRRQRAGQRWQGYAAATLALSYVGYWAHETIVQDRASGVSPSWLVFAVAIGVVIAGYGIAALARTRHPRADETLNTSTQSEALPFLALPALASFNLVAFELQWFTSAYHSFVVGLTASGLLAVGLAMRVTDIRVQGYLTFLVSAFLTWTAVISPPVAAMPVIWKAASIGLLFVAGLAVRRPLARVVSDADPSQRRAESLARVGLAAAAVLLTTVLLAIELRPSLVTMGWGLEGTALLFIGFALRERTLRLAGLGLLFLCIFKLFLYDLRELEALARILSFVALGLVLLGVSWTYTKYREEIKKLL